MTRFQKNLKPSTKRHLWLCSQESPMKIFQNIPTCLQILDKTMEGDGEDINSLNNGSNHQHHTILVQVYRWNRVKNQFRRLCWWSRTSLLLHSEAKVFPQQFIGKYFRAWLLLKHWHKFDQTFDTFPFTKITTAGHHQEDATRLGGSSPPRTGSNCFPKNKEIKSTYQKCG